MIRDTFDPSEGPSAEQMAAEQRAMEQGEKIVQAQEEDRLRKYQQSEAEGEDVSLIGGKFKSQDDLLKAYQELQKKLSNPSENDSEEAEEEATPEAVEETPEEKEIDENVRNFVNIAERFDAEGGLTEEDMATLSSMDSKTLIETYFKYHAVQTKQAQARAASQAEMAEIRQSVGGDEAYGEMIQWAGQNLNEAEIDQFNAVVATNNAAAIKYAVESLSNRWKNAEGFEAPLVTGRKAPSKGKVFRSQAELGRAIADPRYATDPAYRQDVEEKLARSTNLL